MSSTAPDKLKPALIGGVALGVASSIPVLNCFNCFCCALVIGGGLLAAYFYFRKVPPSPQVPYGDAALVGLLAGVIGAVVCVVFAAFFQLLFTQLGFQPGMGLEQLEQVLAEADLPPEVEDWLYTLASGQLSGATLLIQFGIDLVICPIFAMIGALIGAALFHKKTLAPQLMTGGPPPPSPPPAVAR